MVPPEPHLHGALVILPVAPALEFHKPNRPSVPLVHQPVSAEVNFDVASKFLDQFRRSKSRDPAFE